jgi:hypothetical protein
MSIPLDNLYNWINGLLPSPAVLYLFSPHGSKNISDLQWFCDYASKGYKVYLLPSVICHDQEPVEIARYLGVNESYPDRYCNESADLLEQYLLRQNSVLKNTIKDLSYVPRSHGQMLYDHTVILHSEHNSEDIAKLVDQGFVPVYYWSHAVISLDWYRFANIDHRLQPEPIQQKFLIYCRDWADTRSYRIKFLNLLVQHNLHYNSRISFMHTNSESMHYKDCVDSVDRLEEIADNTYDSTASATYDPDDINQTGISVVLETVVDSSKVHITEKVLRPIACGHPFILAAGPGALKYLQKYGFRTFSPWINESYDDEPDSQRRLEMIVEEMHRIDQLPAVQFDELVCNLKETVAHNRKRFYSDEFFQQVQEELVDNLNSAWSQVMQTKGSVYLNTRKLLKQDPVAKDLSQSHEFRHMFKHMLDTLKRLRKQAC